MQREIIANKKTVLQYLSYFPHYQGNLEIKHTRQLFLIKLNLVHYISVSVPTYSNAPQKLNFLNTITYYYIIYVI